MTTTSTRTEVVVGLIVLATIVALVVVAVVRGGSLREAVRTGNDRAAVADVAREKVLALTTVSASGGDEQLDRIREGTTEEFRQQFEEQARAFQKSLSDAEVSSSGTVTSLGVVDLDDTEAEVLVSAVATVENESSTSPAERGYRLRVLLERSSGHWLVAGMDFVA